MYSIKGDDLMTDHKSNYDLKVEKVLYYLSEGYKMLSSQPIFADPNHEKEYHLVFYKEKDVISTEPFRLKGKEPSVIFTGRDEIRKAKLFFNSYGSR